MTVPAENVLQKPSHLTLEEAAAIPLGALTAYRAVVTKGEVKPSDTVIIPGIGEVLRLLHYKLLLQKERRSLLPQAVMRKLLMLRN